MKQKIYFVGIGMGNPDTLTAQGLKAVTEAELLIGAPRLLEAFKEHKGEKLPLIIAEEIEKAVRADTSKKIALIFSGDIGFYSGADKLYRLLSDFEIVTIPGISTLSYLAAKVRLSWQDACCISVHGREAACLGAVQHNHKTFIITGDNNKAEDICKELCGRGMGYVLVHAGERLSYPDERIVSGSAEELRSLHFSGLTAMMVINDRPIIRPYEAPFLKDEDFTRSKVPMTKEETRSLCISKMRLKRGQVLWDVGAGTGSISIECAFALTEGRVYAIEKKEDAAELLKLNRDKFGLYNIEIVKGSAPEALTQLPAPDRVFIGGASGVIKDIITAALNKNLKTGFLITAVTLETLTETLTAIKELNLTQSEVVLTSTAKAVKLNNFHLMAASNPVYIVSIGDFDEQ